jgi:hypothetical protein
MLDSACTFRSSAMPRSSDDEHIRMSLAADGAGEPSMEQTYIRIHVRKNIT